MIKDESLGSCNSGSTGASWFSGLLLRVRVKRVAPKARDELFKREIQPSRNEWSSAVVRIPGPSSDMMVVENESANERLRISMVGALIVDQGRVRVGAMSS